MSLDNEKEAIFSRRSLLIAALKLGLLSSVLGRMVYLQIFKSEEYKTMADDNRLQIRPISPSRGLIYDSRGNVLARNDQNFRLFIIKEKTPDFNQTIQKVADLINLEPYEYEKILTQKARVKSFFPILIKENLSWEQLSKIEFNIPFLEGIYIDVGEIRTYPFQDMTAHFVGYVSAVDSKDQAKNKEGIYMVPGIKLGKSGVEYMKDRELRGVPGSKQMEVNAVGRVVRELSHDKGKMGDDITLTIDMDLQKKVVELISPFRRASCVVMDCITGAVYSYVSYPSYDPNFFVEGISSKRWQELLNHEDMPLNNKAISGQYSPGSIFKCILALTALTYQNVSLNHQVFCPGHFDYAGHRFHCWHHNGGHGTVGFVRAIEQSCDCFFFDLALRLNIDNIAKVARDFGFGQLTNIELTGEVPGLMPDKAWKLKKYGKSWLPGDNINASIGQGYILSTPMQLSLFMARLANGGHQIAPHIIKSDETQLNVAQERLPNLKLQEYKDEHIQLILRAMKGVASPGGTGSRAYIADPHFSIGGKTASTQVKRITMEERQKGTFKNENLPWHLRDHAMFVAFGPTHDPRYALSLVVEHGSAGSKVAPYAREIMLACRDLNPAGL